MHNAECRVQNVEPDTQERAKAINTKVVLWEITCPAEDRG
jgi:hypothetical protein